MEKSAGREGEVYIIRRILFKTDKFTIRKWERRRRMEKREEEKDSNEVNNIVSKRVRKRRRWRRGRRRRNSGRIGDGGV